MLVLVDFVAFDFLDRVSMPTRRRKRRLADAYAFPGFRPLAMVRGVFGNPKARIITLLRRSKKHDAVVAARVSTAGTTAKRGVCAICPAARYSV